MWTTVDRRGDKYAPERMFDVLTWGFLFLTVCGQVGFKYTLKVGLHPVSGVQNDLTTGPAVGSVLGLLPASAAAPER